MMRRALGKSTAQVFKNKRLELIRRVLTRVKADRSAEFLLNRFCDGTFAELDVDGNGNGKILST